ncbi:MAG: hypothetical protein KKC20_24890 [Proteobacteria bacterium]|jgi:hypothetical protein|nr:hypothetical protein [Pseudomonadota bacterium]
MNKITRNTLSIALALIFVSALVIPVFAQDGTTTSGADFSNFIDPDTGEMLPGVIDAGEVTIDNPEWMNTESGSVYNEASYHQYIAPNGDTILAPSATTLNSMLMNPDESGFSASSGSYQSTVGLITSWISLYHDAAELTKYTNQPQYDANGNLSVGDGYDISSDTNLDKVTAYLYENLQKTFLGSGFYSEGSTGITTSFWAALKQATVQALTGANDKMLAGTYLYYTSGNCSKSPVGCQAVCQTNPAACASAQLAAIPTAAPVAPPQCPASTIVPGVPSLGISTTGPASPLVVGQDPNKRGADVSFFVTVPPTVYTYYIPIPIYEDAQICMANEDGSAVANGNCKAGSSTTNNGLIYNIRQLVRVDCEKHVEVYAEPVSAVNASAQLTQDSINWIEHNLAGYYYGATTQQTSFNLVPGLATANAGCDGSKVCQAYGLVEQIQFQDPGTYNLSLRIVTAGTPVSTGRSFATGGSLSVSFISVRLIENGSN